jgi:hypothetical protein
LGNVRRAKIVSETTRQPSQFKDEKGNVKTQDVARVVFEGNPEPLNVSINRATLGGLIKAFGKDSKDWMNHHLSVETEKVRVGGKANIALYLIPAGFKKIDDENGYAVIVSEKEAEEGVDTPPIDEEEIKPTDIPF